MVTMLSRLFDIENYFENYLQTLSESQSQSSVENATNVIAVTRKNKNKRDRGNVRFIMEFIYFLIFNILYFPCKKRDLLHFFIFDRFLLGFIVIFSNIPSTFFLLFIFFYFFYSIRIRILVIMRISMKIEMLNQTVQVHLGYLLGYIN